MKNMRKLLNILIVVTVIVGLRLLVNAPMTTEDDKLLDSAATHNNIPFALVLLILGADPNKMETYSGYAPIHLAVMRNNTSMTRLFIVFGGNVDLQSRANSMGIDEESTPMHFAAKYDAYETAVNLIEREARLDVADRQGCTPICYVRSERMAELLLGNGDGFGCHYQGFHPLHIVAENLGGDAIPVLLVRGAPVDVRDNYERTPLHRAVTRCGSAPEQINRCLRTVKILLQNGARIDVKDKEGKTPLDIAKETKNGKLVELLISAQKPD